tara:strand:+ start:566 stop:1807 length:1242 start_codon:yes stop_codon:yes gene_type:complete
MKKILLFLRLIFSYFILVLNIFEILIKHRKIINFIQKKNNENICICYEGGFGVICQLCDRLIKSDKNFSLILFFDNDRFHNRYFKNFFPQQDIFYLELFSYSYGIKGYLNQKNTKEKKILYLLIKQIIQFYSKKFNIHDGSIKNKISLEIFPKQSLLHDNKVKKILTWRVEKYECPIEIVNPFIKEKSIEPDKYITNLVNSKIDEKILNYEKKICINVRSKYPLIRNTGDLGLYQKSISYLEQLGYLFFFTGEISKNHLFQKINFINKDRVYFNDDFNLTKDVFDFYIPILCEYALFSQSGGLTIRTYAKKKLTLVVNAYPLSYTHFNSVILHKNIFDENGKKINMSNHTIENSPESNIYPNSQEQILESLKTYLKLYEHPNDLTLKTNKNSQIFKRYNPLVDHKDYNCIILS